MNDNMHQHFEWRWFNVKFHLRPSRWDRSPDSLKAGLTISNLEGASVICLTEVADGKRPDTLVDWCLKNGWLRLQERKPWQSGETAILYDAAIWEVIAWNTVAIGPDLGPGLPVVCTLAVLRHRLLGFTTLVGVSHLPSAVEAGFRAKTKRTLAYRKMVRNYRRAVTTMRKKYKPDFEAISADWNLDFNKTWVRAYFGLVWPNHYFVLNDDGGTHGDRQIDAWLIRDAKGNSDILPAHRSSDHRATELHIRKVVEQ